MNELATQSMTSPVNRCALPDAWIDKIFAEMSASYGSKFADMWSGTSPDDLRAKWAAKLAGFRDMPGAIREALDALDSKPFPPTLPEFLAMCREAGHRHSAPVQAISYTPTAEEQARAAEVIAKAANRLTNIDRRDHTDWAKRLQARHEAGEKLSVQQIGAYREALGIRESLEAA